MIDKPTAGCGSYAESAAATDGVNDMCIVASKTDLSE
jgi:hypothetical protein